MYKSKPLFVYGFHATDKLIAKKIINQDIDFDKSEKDFDWLGPGTYFWENSYERAVQYGMELEKRKNSTVKNPVVIGAIIELGNCLDLLNQHHIDFLKEMYNNMIDSISDKSTIPENKEWFSGDIDFKKRELDCAVINFAHQYIAKQDDEPPFDSVRAAFLEGDELYPNAGFKSKNHIQIAILNPNCIKGVFYPRKKIEYPASI